VSSDLSCMSRAIELGRVSLPFAGVNPAVGALIVSGGRVIGEGSHHGPGTSHAEAKALAEAQRLSRSSAKLPPDATLYCTLEPCCHSGAGKRTAPCTEAIIAADIRRVVVACRDPNPLVAGRGIERLRSAGVSVEEGLMAPEAAFLIERFAVSISLRRPYILLKWAQSVDGRIACPGGISKWITNEAARKAAHELRANHDAVMVGANTVRIDNPELTPRLVQTADVHMPRRLVLAGRNPLDLEAHLLSAPLAEGTTVLAATGSPALEQCRSAGIDAIELKADEAGLPDPEEAFHELYARGIGSVMVEGGSALLTSLLRLGLWDAVSIFIAPLIIGEGLSPAGDLGAVSPAQGIGFAKFHCEPGEGFLRIEARRSPSQGEVAGCSRD